MLGVQRGSPYGYSLWELGVYNTAFSDDFSNGSGNWLTFNGSWSVVNGQYCVSYTGDYNGPKAIANVSSYTNFTYDGDVSVASGGNAGLVFRAGNISAGANDLNGYMATMDPAASKLTLGKFVNQTWNPIASVSLPLSPNTMYHMRIVAVGSTIQVFLGDMSTPKISASDSTYGSGKFGFRTWQGDAKFDNIVLAPKWM
jgi:hypothetical protein